MTAEEPPEDMEYDWRKPPKTPVTPPTDTPNVSVSYWSRPTTRRGATSTSPSHQKHRRRRRSASDGRNPWMRTRRRPARPVMRGGAATDGRGGRSTCLRWAASRRRWTSRNSSGAIRATRPRRPTPSSASTGRATTATTTTKSRTGRNGHKSKVDNEKAEPASIDGEYGGGAFSSYNRVHVAVSPIKADPMGFGSSVPTGRSLAYSPSTGGKFLPQLVHRARPVPGRHLRAIDEGLGEVRVVAADGTRPLPLVDGALDAPRMVHMHAAGDQGAPRRFDVTFRGLEVRRADPEAVSRTDFEPGYLLGDRPPPSWRRPPRGMDFLRLGGSISVITSLTASWSRDPSGALRIASAARRTSLQMTLWFVDLLEAAEHGLALLVGEHALLRRRISTEPNLNAAFRPHGHALDDALVAVAVRGFFQAVNSNARTHLQLCWPSDRL